jgi:hypothetical protein
MVLGKGLWLRSHGLWAHEPQEGEAAGVIGRIASEAAKAPGRSYVVIFDPDGMSHQLADTPKVKRAVFATLARSRNEHPVVMSEVLGWGVEPPREGAGGAFSTLLHSELEPGLRDLALSSVALGRNLSAAWSAFTVADECLRLRPGFRTKTVVFLLPGFIATATLGTKRSFRSWTGVPSEKDWKSIRAIMGDGETRSQGPLANNEHRKNGVVVIANGDPRAIFPSWDDYSSSGRIAAVVDIQEFSEAATRLRRSHSANLVASFPRKLDVDRYLAAGAACMFIASAALMFLFAGDVRRLASEREAGRERIAEIQRHLDKLASNQRAMADLRTQAPEPNGSRFVRIHSAMEAISKAIPDDLILNSLGILRSGRVDFMARANGGGFDPEAVRLGFVRAGFVPDAMGGWTYDPKAGSVSFRGTFSEVSP